MANKGKIKGKTQFWQRRRVTLTTGLAAVTLGTYGVLPTFCVELFTFAPVTAPAGSVAIKTQLTESTTEWRTKAKARAKHRFGKDAA